MPRLRLILCSLSFIAPLARADIPTRVIGRPAGRIYAELCSSCHGERLEGGKGPSLVAGAWKHGGDHDSLRRSIRDGYPASEMPAFAAAVDEAETQALIAFIQEAATRAADPAPATEKILPDGVVRSEEHAFRIEVVAGGLDVPWSITFLPGDRMLVTERVGRLRLIDHGRLQPEPIRGVPPVVVRDEAGLMSVVAHPDFAKNGWIYLTFSDPGENGTAMTKIIRGRLRDGGLTDRETVFALPRENYQPDYVLFGGRLAFAGDYLFFSVGERGVFGDAQRLEVPNGKIHRVFHDGTIPPDNPYVRTPGAVGSIWARGVRNPQGLAVDPRDGALWETEHGPRGGDELNWIRPNRNYGWPLITYGVNYDGTPVTDRTTMPGMEQPVRYWTPSIAVSEIEFYTGDRFPRWKGQLFAGSLAQQKFLRLVIDAEHRVIHVEEVFKHLGRVRDIKTGPDGCLYVALEWIGKPGVIVRLVPADDR